MVQEKIVIRGAREHNLKGIDLEIPRDRLVGIDIPRPEGAAWFTAVVTPEGGPVVVAHRALRRNPNGSLVTGYPWRPLRTTVEVPVAYEDAAVTLPDGG